MLPPASDWASARLRLALVLAVAATLCALWWTGMLADAAEPARVRRLLSDGGWPGPLLWALAFMCLEPFGVPGAVFLIPAALVWPPSFAIAMSVAAATGAGLVAFGLARWIGREAIVARLPERVKRRTAAAREHGFRTAFWIRIVFFLFPPAHWALAISGIRLTPFVLGSALGFLPWAIGWVLTTREVAARVGALPDWEAIVLGVVVVAGLLAFAAWRRRRAG